MSEKEERILIIPCRSECNCIRPVGNELYCGAYIHGDWVKIDPEKDCKNCKHAQYNGISRAEAIEKMAEAMEVPYFDDIHASEPDMLEALAAAALDALIKEI